MVLDKLKLLQKNAYVPYSKFRVSAILIDKDGKEWSGVNIENASIGATNCAERTAVFSAVANGVKDFKEIHILADMEEKPISPCGICRQVLSEFMDKDAKVYLYAQNGNMKVFTIEEILPYAFSSKDMK